MVTGRRPFTRDEAVIDYEMDSEEEFEEENGEDVNDDMSEEEEDCEGDSFIVSDGYVSKSERGADDMVSDDGNQEGKDKAREAFKRMNKNKPKLAMIVKPTVIMYDSR